MLMAAAMLVKIVGGHECRHERGQKFVGMACAGNLDEVARLVMRRSWVHLEEIAEKNAPQVSRPVEGERGVGAAITLLQDSVSKTIIDKKIRGNHTSKQVADRWECGPTLVSTCLIIVGCAGRRHEERRRKRKRDRMRRSVVCERRLIYES